MALAEELPVYKASYDLLLMIFSLTKNFQKDYKYTIGESLKNEVVDVVTSIYRANSSDEKRSHLSRAREGIEVIRLYVRLLKDLHQINVKQLVAINVHIENISKQLTGWQKSVMKKEGKLSDSI
ncbi:MAG: four helix bundle protein [Ignavibacteria bacterium]|nr:four helix bundle protein [Ignavibacteria bacterium]